MQDFPTAESDILFLNDTVQQYKTTWDQNEPKLCIVFNHKDLSLITDSLNRFSSYVSLNSYADTKTELNVLEMQVEKANHVMGFNLQNIF